jgi:LmbE family N-acetylglucosaminyl deacetylase
MAPDAPPPTRKDFLLAMAGAALLPRVAPAQTANGKLLIVVAHPDDESAFAAATYRLVRESGWAADQVTITDGESGYRYATLAETYYGVPLTHGGDGRAHLAAIRKEEALRAGKVLGIRRHYFLDQKDLGFDTDAASAETGNWDRGHIRSFLSGLLTKERYDAIFTLLPTAETHGHHRAATVLALETAANLPDGHRPLIFGAESRSKSDPPRAFAESPAQPLTRTVDPAPVITFNRDSSFGYRNALNYQIVVNWVIAEHKSQGLFQNDYGREEYVQFWLFEASGKDAAHRLPHLQTLLREPAHSATAGYAQAPQ